MIEAARARLPPGTKATAINGALLTQLAKNEVAGKLVDLLSTKHLYQSVEIDITGLRGVVDLHEPLPGPHFGGVIAPSKNEIDKSRAKLRGMLDALLLSNWEFLPEVGVQPPGAEPIGLAQPVLRMTIPHVTLFCSLCKTEGPHSSGYRDRKDFLPEINLGDGVQVLFFPFQCDRCRGEPVFFTIRREKGELRIVGRSQFEEVDVPKTLPKEETKYFRHAVISHNCGRTLAGLFYLRVMIEQYMRRVTKAGAEQFSGDELGDRYSKLLDPEFPKSMVTMKKIYAELSDKIHSPSDDTVQFEKARSDICKHFEQLRLIPLVTPDPK